MSSSPVILLAPGAWSSSSFYDKIQSCFRDRGFTTEALTHPSTGAEPPTITLDDDVAHMKNTLDRLCDAGKDVIIVAHSYGGLVSSSAVEGLAKSKRQKEGKSGGVVMLVYMVAFVVPKGFSLIQASGGQLMPWIKTEGNYAYCDIGPEGAFNDLPSEERGLWYSRLTHTCLPVFSGVSSYEPWQDIPTAYILGEEDRMLPLGVQEQMVQMLGTSRTYRLKTSHHPFLSVPEEVAEIVQGLSVVV